MPFSRMTDAEIIRYLDSAVTIRVGELGDLLNEVVKRYIALLDEREHLLAELLKWERGEYK